MSLPKALGLMLALATPAAAQPLAQMGGDWRGTGWAREVATGPQEAVRCRIKNTYDAEALTLTVRGQCVVPGRKLNMAGSLKGKDGSEKITGRWANPNGLGRTKVTGVQRDGVVAFTFRVKDEDTGEDISQNVVWRLDGDRLRLKATDRADAGLTWSEITFTR